MTEGYHDLCRRLLTVGAIVRTVAGFRREILPAGPPRIIHVQGTFPAPPPSKPPVAASADWITGHSMRKYAERCLRLAAPTSDAVARRVSALREAVRRDLAEGRVSRALRGAMPQLRRMLGRTGASLPSHPSGPEMPRIPDLERLLDTLRPYGGDRISVVMNEHLLPRLAGDSSEFNVVLSRSAFALFRHKPVEPRSRQRYPRVVIENVSAWSDALADSSRGSISIGDQTVTVENTIMPRGWALFI